MDNLYYEIIKRNRLISCAHKIQRKACAGVGVDNIICSKAVSHLLANIDELIWSLSNDIYVPSPIRRVSIEKPNGGIRYIGIPTIMDKIIQQSILEILTPIYERIFNPYSYGFREHRNIHQAILQAKEYINNGYIYIIQIDLSNFFDTIHHDKMMSELYKTIKDKQLLHLIRLYLQSDILYRGKPINRNPTKGMAQGGNLSPLLANVYLHALDTEISRRGIRFIRYADDISIFCNSMQSATAIHNNICRFIEKKLLLEINYSKTKIVTPTNCNMFGFQFYTEQSHYKSCISNKSIQRLKNKLHCNIHNAMNIEKAIQAVNYELIGWYSYYSHADKYLSKRAMKRLDRCILEWLYKQFPCNQNITHFKEQLMQDNRKLSMIEIYKLSNNSPNC